MLSAIAWGYGQVTALRNLLYDKGIFEVHDLGARTISVGNITAGGTGKTPLVAYIARALADSGEKVCILTRGYGRVDENSRVLVSDGETVLVDAGVGGDEPVELAHSLLGKAIVIADADRVGAAEWATRKFKVTAFVLDDGFQHRRVKRDVDILCIDATDPFGGRKMLPAGRLREAIQGSRRADAVVLTRVEQIDGGDVSDLRYEISEIAPDADVFESMMVFDGFTAVGNDDRAVGPKSDDTLFAFCGVGSPSNFFTMLSRTGRDVVGTMDFRDHHPYSNSDITMIDRKAKAAGASALVTTAKDAVKLAGLTREMPIFVANIRIEISDERGFTALL